MAFASRFFPDPGHEPRLYHIAAVGPNFNRISYSVECFVALIFSLPVSSDEDGYEPQRLRLDPLVADESQSGPSSIELILHGRWRRALKWIRKKDVVRVESASVTHASDQEIHPHQLELFDPIVDAVRASRTRVYVRSAGSASVPQSPVTSVPVVSYEELDRGLIAHRGQSFADELPPLRANELGRRKEASGLNNAIPSLGQVRTRRRPVRDNGVGVVGEPDVPRSSARPRSRAAKLSVLNFGQVQPRNHEYSSSIRALWDRVTRNRPSVVSEKVNVYGVVIEARGPCVTKGPDMRSEVVIVDESSPSPSSDCSELRTLRLHRFESLPQDAIPFCSTGDVIRAHRVHLDIYDDKRTGAAILQGCGKYYSTYVLWSSSSDSDEPIASLQPVRTAKSSERPANVKHTITDWDRQRVRKLRAWGAEFLRACEAIDRPFLHTVPQMLRMLKDGLIRQPFDLIGYFEGGENEESDDMQFYISGRGPHCVGDDALVKVVGCPVERVNGDPVSFEMFSPSWRLREHIDAGYLLIHDAYCLEKSTAPHPVVHLMAGDKTSTILWLRNDSPEVRFADKQDMPTGNLRPAAREVGSFAQNDVQAASVVPNHQPHKDYRWERSWRTGGLARGEREISRDHQDLAHVGDFPAYSAQKGGDMERDTTVASLAMAQAAVPAGLQTNEIKKACFTTNGIAEVPYGKSIVSSHGNLDKPCSPLMEVRRQVLASGNSAPPFRVVCSVVAWMFPEDLFAACSPWCKACSSFLTRKDSPESRFQCGTCHAHFADPDDRDLHWAFNVKLLLEDVQGTRLETWIEGNEALTFFRSVNPTNLASPSAARTREKLLEYAALLLKPETAIDCCVKGYSYRSSEGVTTMSSKIFGTALLLAP